jgi:PKD repeat protein
MPLPISIIGYNVISGLAIKFNSLSLNMEGGTPTHSWVFGDGSSSTEENPEKEYSAAAIYNVSLTVTNGLGTNTSSIILNLTNQVLPNTLIDIPLMVDLYSPTSVIGHIKYNSQKSTFIAKWQNYLQPLVVDPEVTLENTYNSNVYPQLANSLIARLVVIDIILAEAAAFTIHIASSGQIDSSGSSTDSSNTTISTAGGIKSIETGPTKIERYENKDISSQSEKVSNLSKAYQQLIVRDGVLDQMKHMACQDALRLQIYLPMCPMPASIPRGLKVSKCKKRGGYNSNPFGITDRMT